MTAQHLRDLAQPRRSATVAAVAIRLEAELTDATLLMFDKLMGGLSRRAERRASDNAASALRDAQSYLRLLARAGRALIAAREEEADAAEAVEQAVGWVPFLRAVAEAERLAQPETVDVRAELVQRWSAMRQFAPALLEALAFEGAAGVSGLLKAVALLRAAEPRRQAHAAQGRTGRLHPPWLAAFRYGHGRQAGAPGLGGVRAVRAARPTARRRRVGAGQSPLPQFRGLPAAQADSSRHCVPRDRCRSGCPRTWTSTSRCGRRSLRRQWPRLPPWPRPASYPTPRSTRAACGSPL